MEDENLKEDNKKNNRQSVAYIQVKKNQSNYIVGPNNPFDASFLGAVGL